MKESLGILRQFFAEQGDKTYKASELWEIFKELAPLMTEEQERQIIESIGIPQCFCQSYYDDDGVLRDCTCGKCGLGKSWEDRYPLNTFKGRTKEELIGFIQEEIKQAREEGYHKGANFKQNYADRAYKQARQELIEEVIKLSDEIEMREPDGGIKEWRAFKCFRNTLRDKYLK